MKTIIAADLFCGAGGASVGLRRACEALGLGLDLLAINHWPIAVQTHMANHPGVRHLCESVERVVPRDAVPGGRLHLLLAGPSCVHHSRARGGRPVNEQERASAWCVLRWLSELTVDHVLIENVEEFREWGPVGVTGRPMRARRGETYRAFIGAIESLGYRVEERILNAADYGDPTTCRRLWIMAQRRGRPTWPTPTHSREGGRHLFGASKRWRAAREIIDWTITGQSIFARKKPLSEKTMARIFAGLKRFGGAALEPFLLHVTHGTDVGRVHQLDVPVPTVTGANRGELGLCEPFVLQQQSGGAPRSVARPLPTLAGRGAQSLVEPFLVAMFGERVGHEPRTHDVEQPLPTVTATKGAPALVEPFLTSYYGTGSSAAPVSDPLPTATARDRFGLVMPEVDGMRLDIRFRMLQPHELAAAMSFGAGYRFAGNRGDQVKQIGNAWPCATAQALCFAVIERYAEERAPRRIEAAG